MNRWAWIGAALTLATAGYLTRALMGADQSLFVPGPGTHGHYQIIDNCAACHTPMMGVKTEACMECHQEELSIADDSHPAAKFSDPRRIDLLDRVRVTECTACHVEHQPSMTWEMGVTLPEDYCFHCHSDIAKERPDHDEYAFDTCLAGGCHNFHDNRALTEDFLEKHLEDVDTIDGGLRGLLARASVPDAQGRTGGEPPPPEVADPEIDTSWSASRHAQAAVSCASCHLVDDRGWVREPSYDGCGECHAEQKRGFEGGHHGMRLAAGLSPMTPASARQPMHPEVADEPLTCGSCHDVHSVDTIPAQVDACLRCHADEHTLAYRQSAHWDLWRKELAGDLPRGSGVSCATCHMPAVAPTLGAQPTHVQHNQNDNLRPNEKMVRPVCMSCHGVEFAEQALADRAAIAANFSVPGSGDVETFDLIRTKRRLASSDSATERE